MHSVSKRVGPFQLLRFTFALAVFAASCTHQVCSADDPQPSKEGQEKDRAAQVTVLKDATIHSMNGAAPFVGSVVVTDGEISEVGTTISTPDGATVINLKGMHLTPGLIESRGALWMTSAATGESNSKAELNVLDAIDPWSKDWQELAAQGVTSVYVQPNSTGLLGGYGAVLRVGPHPMQDIVLKEKAAVQASVGLSGATSKDRYAQVQAFKKLIESAVDKKKDEKDKDGQEKEEKADDSKADEKGGAQDKKDEKADAKKKDDGKSGDKKKDDEKKKDEKVDPAKEAIKAVLNNELPMFLEVHYADVLKPVLEIAKEHELPLVLDGLSKVHRCCQQLTESGYPIVVGPFYEYANAPNYRQDADYSWLADASEAGQLWTIGTFSRSAIPSRLLRMQAAMAIAKGADHDKTLAAITANAARLLRVDEHVGTIAAGKQADIAVFAGDPLDPASRTALVMSHGKITFQLADEQLADLVDAAANKATETAATADAGELPDALPANYAIKSTRVWQDGKFTAATLVVKDGVISSIGDEVAEVVLFDVGDAVITPGLVSAHTTLGQDSAIIDADESDTSHLRSVDAFDPMAKTAREILAGGFIHIGLSPGQRNTSPGAMGHVRLGANDYVANELLAAQFVLSGDARTTERYPSSLNGQLEMLRGLFDGQPSDSVIYVSAELAKAIAAEKIANVKAAIGGQRGSIFVANSSLEIRSALALADEFKIAPVIVTNGRVGEHAEQLAAQKCSLVVPQFNGSEFDSRLHQFIMAHQAGVPLAFSGTSSEKIRMTAALLANAGLPASDALTALTSGGAEVMGMSNVGLAANAPADFVVWTDSPLNLAAKVVRVVVDGQVIEED